MNNYNSEPTNTCEGTKQATIADIEQELHVCLVDLREMLKSYIERMYGTETTENEPLPENPKSFIGAMSYDLRLSVEVRNLAKYLCEGLGV